MTPLQETVCEMLDAWPQMSTRGLAEFIVRLHPWVSSSKTAANVIRKLRRLGKYAHPFYEVRRGRGTIQRLRTSLPELGDRYAGQPACFTMRQAIAKRLRDENPGVGYWQLAFAGHSQYPAVWPTFASARYYFSKAGWSFLTGGKVRSYLSRHMLNAERTSAVKFVLALQGNSSTRSMARILFRDFPELFRTPGAARVAIKALCKSRNRYITSTNRGSRSSSAGRSRR